MAAYAALLSLAQTIHLNTTPNTSLFSPDSEMMVRSIHVYVDSLLSFFEEFPKRVNRWENRIRDIAHETEDIMERYIWQKIQSRHSRVNSSRVKLEDQLEIVMEEIGLIAGEVTEERPAYQPPSSSTRLESTSCNNAVVGLEEDIMAIKERLCGQSSDLQFIPIVGMGGIGKSTLAKTLYEDPLIMSHFDVRAWVVVSQDYSPNSFRRILLDSIMKFLEKDQMSGDEMDRSETEVRVFQNLKKRRYLVVIDDVWDPQSWDDVRCMFPDDSNGSRIVLTTRQSDVASYPKSDSPLHQMRFMKDSQSWDLLKLKVFGNGDCPSELEEVGKEIAGRCAGLPLAVVLVAGVLSPVSQTRASWDEIAENVNPAVGWEIEEILSLSYNYLPHHLRPCFLYIGGFLDDVNIGASRLVRLWVAEGFVKHDSRCSKSLEEVAEEYLEDLVKRNLVMVTSKKTNGKIKSCSLHDMVRGLCIRKAHEEKFFHVMDGRDLPQGLMNERRISFSHADIDRIWCPTFRTILGFKTHNLPALLGSYKLLRVLDALGVDLKELPFEVFELYRLRYLALMSSSRIPSAISNLVNLETLIIHLASGKTRRIVAMFHSLPLEIWRMPQLRHLFFHGSYELPHPPEVFNCVPLENLQTLLNVKDLVWNEKIPQLIPNVKRLGLHYTGIDNCNLHHLKDMHQLEKLDVTGLQDWQHASFPCMLKKLTLVGGGFLWKDMAVLGSLPNLEVLKLLGNACNGKTWETTDEEFPRLKVLLIDESHLIEWVTYGSPFPTLKHLVLRSCSYLREVPEAIGEISTLELIEVDYCQQSLGESAKEIKEYQESWGNDALHVRIGHEVREISTLKHLVPSVFMFASGENSWWAFDREFKSRWKLPILPSDPCFASGDKESFCAGTHLLVSGREIDGLVVWRYDLASNIWHKGPPMINPRCLFASATFGDCAYVAGGMGSVSRDDVYDTAEKYNPESGAWAPLPRMRKKRKLCAGFYMDDRFYVIGGRNGDGELTCGEFFDEKRNRWEVIADMVDYPVQSSHSPPLLAVVNNELYSLEDSSNQLKVYLKGSNTWRQLGRVPVRADYNRGWGVAFKSLGNELLVIGAAADSCTGNHMAIYTCCPEAESGRLEWKLVENSRNRLSHFILNCSVMVA